MVGNSRAAPLAALRQGSNVAPRWQQQADAGQLEGLRAPSARHRQVAGQQGVRQLIEKRHAVRHGINMRPGTA
jgi:hypothetical protein